MDEEKEIIPESLRPMVDSAKQAWIDKAIKDQTHSEFVEAYKAKAISIEDAEKFLDEHRKTGVFMLYWDQDELSEVNVQALTCGKGKADRVLANIFFSAGRTAGLW